VGDNGVISAAMGKFVPAQQDEAFEKRYVWAMMLAGKAENRIVWSS
jgi:hypothetical protein